MLHRHLVVRGVWEVKNIKVSSIGQSCLWCKHSEGNGIFCCYAAPVEVSQDSRCSHFAYDIYLVGQLSRLYADTLIRMEKTKKSNRSLQGKLKRLEKKFIKIAINKKGKS